MSKLSDPVRGKSISHRPLDAIEVLIETFEAKGGSGIAIARELRRWRSEQKGAHEVQVFFVGKKPS